MVPLGESERDNLVSDFYPAFKLDAPAKRKPMSTPQKRAAMKRCGKENESLEKGSKKPRAAPASSPRRDALSDSNGRQPTDFSTLFQSVRQSQGGDKKASMVTSFEDVAHNARPTVQPVPAQRDQFSDKLTALLRANVTSEPSEEGSRDKLEATRVAISNIARQPTSLANLELPPLDWSLKTSIRFASHSPFKTCRTGLQSSASTVASSLAGLACRHDLDCVQGTICSIEEEWHQSLLSWQHPDACFEASIVAALNLEKEGKTMSERRAKWQAAFSSLYYALRSGKCRAFYLISSKGTRNPFIVLFKSRQVCSNGRVTAYVSRSTRGMRAMISRPPNSLDFDMPLAPTGAIDACSEKHTRELLELGQVPGGDNSGLDNKSASLLSFEGPSRVHGLYNWLLDSATSPAAEATDVPQLLSPSPFLGASLAKLQPQIAPLATSAAGAADSLYRFEIQGFIPPWCVKRICAALKRGSDQTFQALLETDPVTSNLNVETSSSEGSTEANVPKPGRSSKLLWENTQKKANCYVRDLACSKGVFASRHIPIS